MLPLADLFDVPLESLVLVVDRASSPRNSLSQKKNAEKKPLKKCYNRSLSDGSLKNSRWESIPSQVGGCWESTHGSQIYSGSGSSGNMTLKRAISLNSFSDALRPPTRHISPSSSPNLAAVTRKRLLPLKKPTRTTSNEALRRALSETKDTASSEIVKSKFDAIMSRGTVEIMDKLWTESKSPQMVKSSTTDGKERRRSKTVQRTYSPLAA